MPNFDSPLIYLDSSDFSSLSTALPGTELAKIKQQLIELSGSSRVRFVFSGVHLSEMSPLKPGHATSAAEARADLLVDLCGRRTMLCFDRLMKLELDALAERKPVSTSVVSENGEWYPEWDENLINPVEWVETWKSFAEAAKLKGINRATRRNMKSRVTRKGKPTAEVQALLVENEESMDYQMLVQQFPMRLSDAQVLGKFLVGAATQDEANEALLESLRDPRWMMRWFATHAENMSALTEWLRGPAAQMTNISVGLAKTALHMQGLKKELGDKFRSELKFLDSWHASQDDFVCSAVGRIQSHFKSAESSRPVVASEVSELCPGISTFFRTAHSSAGASVTAHPRKPKDSDFVDAVHAMYAPYVDIFRTDRFMAPHIKAHAPPTTRVVGKLKDLIGLISDRIT